MKAKIAKGPNGPTPKALTAVYSLRNIDGEDIQPGVYCLKPGEYLSATCRDGVPVGKVKKLTPKQAFAQMTALQKERHKRPGVDVWNCLEWRLVRESMALDPALVGTADASPGGIFVDSKRGKFYAAQVASGGKVFGVQSVNLGEALLIAAVVAEHASGMATDCLHRLLLAAGNKLKRFEAQEGGAR